MTRETQPQAVIPREVADPVVGNDEKSPKQARASARAFRPVLTVGVLSSRWLQSFATPGHGQGASL